MTKVVLKIINSHIKILKSINNQVKGKIHISEKH